MVKFRVSDRSEGSVTSERNVSGIRKINWTLAKIMPRVPIVTCGQGKGGGQRKGICTQSRKLADSEGAAG